MKRCLAASFALLFACSMFSSACLAGPYGEARLQGRYDDLDLTTPEGVKILDQRFKRSADQVCADAAGTAPGGQMDLGCRADALAAARAQMPRLIAEQRLSKSRAVASANPR